MNIPRLLIAIVAGFAFIFASDFLIHGFWLDAEYKASAQLWRPEAEMYTLFHWMLTAQLLSAVAFMFIWARWIASGSMLTGCSFGFCFGVAQQVWAIIFFVVSPVPGTIAAKWFAAGVVQAMVLGVIATGLYRPPVVQRSPRTV